MTAEVEAATNVATSDLDDSNDESDDEDVLWMGGSN